MSVSPPDYRKLSNAELIRLIRKRDQCVGGNLQAIRRLGISVPSAALSESSPYS